MSRPLAYKPLSKKLLDKDQINLVDKVLHEASAEKPPSLSSSPLKVIRNIEPVKGDTYEFLDPEQALKTFGKFLRDVETRYETNEERVATWQDATQDLLHEIEFAPKMNAAKGYAAYAKLREIRIERRRAKTENELIEPMYDWLKGYPDMVNQIGKVQGDSRVTKEKINNRSYTQRTIHSNIED